MLKKIFFTTLLFLQVLICHGQLQTLKGKIIANYDDLQGINIENLSQKKTYFTEKQGYFTIAAKICDTLNFSAVQFKGLQVVLNQKNFNNELFFVNMEVMTNYLNEAIVTKEKSGFEMGILTEKAKQFTPAERKLNTASNYYASLSAGTSMGGITGLDPILNWLSGRTAMLKKELKIEKKELALQKIENLFEENYFTKILNIPKENVLGFAYFIVEDAEFVKALNSKNKTMAKFLLINLASNYLNLQKQK